MTSVALYKAASLYVNALIFIYLSTHAVVCSGANAISLKNTEVN